MCGGKSVVCCRKTRNHAFFFLSTHLPYVRSTRPLDNLSTRSRSEIAYLEYFFFCHYGNFILRARCTEDLHFAPPAYVVGIVTSSPRTLRTRRVRGVERRRGEKEVICSIVDR